MKVVAIDVGIKNLAFCIASKGNIHLLEVYKLTDKTCSSLSYQELTKIITDHLNKIFIEPEFEDITNVLIELQPKFNQKMKFVSHVIFTKFVETFQDAKVVFISSKSKLKQFSKTEKSTYTKRKKLSIQYATEILQDYPEVLEKFNKCSKKDDAGDVVCYIANYL